MQRATFSKASCRFSPPEERRNREKESRVSYILDGKNNYLS
jgi:hypothetical protein